MPPDTTKAKVGGVTEFCLYNDHALCNNPRCGCDCHTKAAVEEAAHAVSYPQSVDEGPQKTCPKCKIKRPTFETFCRVDGTRLSSLACAVCAAGREPEDKFCFSCGAPADTTPVPITPLGLASPSSPSVVKVPIHPPQPKAPVTVVQAPEYDKLLSAIHMELEAAKSSDGGSNGTTQAPRTVVEQPGGPQGGFKLVSAPSPNKIRTQSSPPGGQVRAATPTTSQRIKLPIKPS